MSAAEEGPEVSVQMSDPNDTITDEDLAGTVYIKARVPGSCAGSITMRIYMPCAEDPWSKLPADAQLRKDYPCDYYTTTVASFRAEVERQTHQKFPAVEFPIYCHGVKIKEELLFKDSLRTPPHFHEIGHMETLWMKTSKDEHPWTPIVGMLTFLVLLGGWGALVRNLCVDAVDDGDCQIVAGCSFVPVFFVAIFVGWFVKNQHSAEHMFISDEPERVHYKGVDTPWHGHQFLAGLLILVVLLIFFGVMFPVYQEWDDVQIGLIATWCSLCFITLSLIVYMSVYNPSGNAIPLDKLDITKLDADVRSTLFQYVCTRCRDPDSTEPFNKRSPMFYPEKKRYHCRRCNKCCTGFDHHCPYINQCVGINNYKPFFAMLCFFLLFMMFTLGFCIYSIVKTFDSGHTINYNVELRWGKAWFTFFSSLLAAVSVAACGGLGHLTGFNIHLIWQTNKPGGRWTSTFTGMEARKHDDDTIRDLVDLIIGRNLFPCKMWSERIAFNVLMDRFQKMEYTDMKRKKKKLDSKGMHYEPPAEERRHTMIEALNSPRAAAGLEMKNVSGLSDDELDELYKQAGEDSAMFELLDLDKDGFIDASELKLLMKGFGLSGADEDQVIKDTLRGIEKQEVVQNLNQAKLELADLHTNQKRAEANLEDFQTAKETAAQKGQSLEYWTDDKLDQFYAALDSWGADIANKERVIKVLEAEEDTMDKNYTGDDKMDKKEFLSALNSTRIDTSNLKTKRKDLEHVFRLFDKDDDKRVGLNDLKRVRDELNKDPDRQIDLDDDRLKEMLDQLDVDNDGGLELDEFIDALVPPECCIGGNHVVVKQIPAQPSTASIGSAAENEQPVRALASRVEPEELPMQDNMRGSLSTGDEQETGDVQDDMRGSVSTGDEQEVDNMRVSFSTGDEQETGDVQDDMRGSVSTGDEANPMQEVGVPDRDQTELRQRSNRAPTEIKQSSDTDQTELRHRSNRVPTQIKQSSDTDQTELRQTQDDSRQL